jgi:DNA-binding MarR family transcriptional regulator
LLQRLSRWGILNCGSLLAESRGREPLAKDWSAGCFAAFFVFRRIATSESNEQIQGRSVANKLKDEIRQNKPFSGLEQEAMLNIRRTSGYVEHIAQQVLKQHGLTEPQYNVLRILRGAGPDGLRCSEIGERMITRDPDITRLLGRLQQRRLVERRRDTGDRRVVHIRITADGNGVLRQLDPVVEAAATSTLSHLSRERLVLLIDLMEEVRQGGCGARSAADELRCD